MKKIIIIVIAVILMGRVDWILSIEAHDGPAWTHIAGGYGLFGLVGCLLLIVVAKVLALLGIQRKEDSNE